MSDPKKKRPMTASDYINTQPHMQGKPLTIQNTFSALAEFPPLSYSKAVTAQPAGQSSNPNPTNPPTQKSPYHIKPYYQHLQTTQFTKSITLAELKRLVNSLFYETCYYPTDNVIKDRTFYEYILVDSGSIEVTHYQDKSSPNLISYSTCKILRIRSIQDLGFLNRHTLQSFRKSGYHIPGYSYTDYQDAFFRMFYLRPYDHSWFISFDIKCPKQVPGWFNEWWHWFGPTENIYPTNVIKPSLPYYTKKLVNNPIGPFSKIAFHIDMGIPWICSWNFDLCLALPDMPYSLVRKFRVKWWDKYDLNRCSLENIQRLFNIKQEVQTTVRSISKSIPLVTPSQLQQPPPTTTQPHPKEPTPQSPTHSQSSSRSHSRKSRQKENLKKVLTQLAHQLNSSSDEDDDDDEDMGASDPLTDSDPFGGPLAQGPLD